MDPITSAALTGLMMVAADAAKETTTKLASIAWGKIKQKLGWTSDVPAAEIKARATPALAENPELAKEIERIANDYRTQVLATHGGTASRDYYDNRGASFNIQGGAKFGGS